MRTIKSNDKYKFKAETWESNKGFELGFMGWGLFLWIEDLEHWYKLDGSHRNYPLHPTNAERIANEELEAALSGRYDERIRDCIIGE